MSSKRVLDFIIIGAQKSGTTSLFRYLETHPQIYMPPEKEIPYFSDPARLAKGWDWYLDEFFGEAPADQLWGTSTPHYMTFPGVAGQIKRVLPNVKLIALLRHPIDRAYSQFRMAVRRGYETRTFEQAVDELLKPEVLQEARESPGGTNTYLTLGEYGRILATFYEHFAPEQITVFFASELENQPATVSKSIFEFLGVRADFVPPNLGAAYHRGGTRRRLPWADYRRLKGVGFLDPLRAIWRGLVPLRNRKLFWYWLEQWNVVPDKGKETVTAAVRRRLGEHFEADGQTLSALTGRAIPWAFHEQD